MTDFRKKRDEAEDKSDGRGEEAARRAADKGGKRTVGKELVNPPPD